MEMIKSNGSKRGSVALDEDHLVFVNQIRAIRRKRIMVSSSNRRGIMNNNSDSNMKTPVKNSNGRLINGSSSSLESLPQDVLIRILCCVDHDDLKQLCQVSESIKEAASIAKRDHFAFSTPSKKLLPGLRSFCDDLEFDDEPPNAPKQHRNHHRKSRVDGKKLGDISVALFRSPEKQQWRRNLFFDTETEI